MQFETSANPFIRPSLGHSPKPAYAVAPSERQEIAKGPTEQRRQLATAPTEVGSAPEVKARPGVEESMGFEDLLDVVNPLQHLPVVSTLYREMTGDQIAAPARILGGLLYGGPVGFVASAANAIAEEATGRDLGEAAVASLIGEETDPTLVAQASAEAALPEPAAGAEIGLLPPVKSSGFRAPPPPELAAAAAAAPAPAQSAQTDETLYTGEAALDALAADLRRSQPATSPDLASSPPPAPVDPSRERQLVGQAPAANSAVPANLVGLGARDRRGLAPAKVQLRMPMPTDRLPNKLPGAAAAPSGMALLEANQTAAPATAGGQALSGDVSAQMIDALKKYEALMKGRKGAS